MKANKYLGVEERHSIEQKGGGQIEGVYKKIKPDFKHRAGCKK
jgi:hypothetical protein